MNARDSSQNENESQSKRKLYLIRHGQAGGEKYNKLTPLGEKQARALGVYFARQKIQVDLAATGTLERQRETYQLFAEAFTSETGRPPPEPTVVPGLDEITPDIWFTLGEELRHKDPEFRGDFKQWLGSLRESEKRGVAKEAYINVLTQVIEVWVKGDYEASDIESFQDFYERVLGTRAQLPGTQANSDADGGSPARDLVVISSGTPIALLIGKALGFDLQRSLEFTRRVANTSLSIFETSGDLAWEPITINSLPHLSHEIMTEI
ncbi:MAG: histidine phosphatase family protein [bacterium]|nr:histidine phosphatase family protein [bacterium]